MGWWKVDLGAAAWTGTHSSFIQEAVSKVAPDAQQISRADECRLMFLSHEKDHATPPLFPFAPFGFTALQDTDLDVRRHAHCAETHGLVYDSFTWDCVDSRKVKQERKDRSASTIRLKVGQQPGWESNTTVNYDELDSEDEVSEMATRNVFTWLRGDGGFPMAERAIREHEWIDNLDSDDDGPIEGKAQSTAGGNVGEWLSGMLAKRSNSL